MKPFPAPPPLSKCPQCTSMWCGPTVCRFSGLTHEEARTPKINTSFNVGWMATFEGYDGAPDAHDPIGLGMTQQQAIDSLLEQQEEA